MFLAPPLLLDFVPGEQALANDYKDKLVMVSGGGRRRGGGERGGRRRRGRRRRRRRRRRPVPCVHVSTCHMACRLVLVLVGVCWLQVLGSKDYVHVAKSYGFQKVRDGDMAPWPWPVEVGGQQAGRGEAGA